MIIWSFVANTVEIRSIRTEIKNILTYLIVQIISNFVTVFVLFFLYYKLLMVFWARFFDFRKINRMDYIQIVGKCTEYVVFAVYYFFFNSKKLTTFVFLFFLTFSLYLFVPWIFTIDKNITRLKTVYFISVHESKLK